MIRKLLLSLLIIGLGIINFSSASYVGSVGTIGDYQINTFYDSVDVAALRKGGVLTNKLGLQKSIFYTTQFGGFFWGSNGLPYMFTRGNRSSSTLYQGYLTKYSVCDLITSETQMVSNCSFENIDSEVSPFVFSNFFNGLTNSDYYFYYGKMDGTSVACNSLCFSSVSFGRSLCFTLNRAGSSNALSNCPAGTTSSNLTGSIGLTINDIEFDNIDSSLLNNPPWWGGNPEPEPESGGIELDTELSAITYFEDYLGRDESICYVGVDNVTDLWGSSGVSFEAGSGLNLFQVYTGIYNTGVELDHVYVWLNNWLINYENWFGTNGNPQYLSNYNSGTNQVDIYYDNLTFPFAGNPVAVYFLSDNIERLSPTSTMGSEVVSYCNIKVNNGTFDEILSDSIKNNIRINTEQVNYSNGYNRDGTLRQFSGFMDGTGIYFLSGVDIQEFTGDMSDFFDRTIDKFKSFVDTQSNPFTGVLPNWLIFAFLLIVLFKILRNY